MKRLHLDAKSSERFIPGAFRFLIGLIILAGVLCLASIPALMKGGDNGQATVMVPRDDDDDKDDKDDDDDDQAGKPGACTKTAGAVLKACQLEARNDFWIATGYCNNLSDPTARAECKRAAQAALKEGKEECRAQFEARREVCALVGEARYDPQIDPSMFVDPAQIGHAVAPNPYFPLIRGRTLLYKGGTETVTVTVTGDTKVILGVTCAVIRDIVKDDGQVIEDTKDRFAQDIYGNVWYFGEITKEFENGELVSIDGTFTAGVDGAKAGIIMKAAPAVGDVYRQEFSLNNAEDLAKVLSVRGSATVPAASCQRNCLVTRDFTPLEPGVFERKYYAPGIGSILELKPQTGERLELVEIRN